MHDWRCWQLQVSHMHLVSEAQELDERVRQAQQVCRVHVHTLTPSGDGHH